MKKLFFLFFLTLAFFLFTQKFQRVRATEGLSLTGATSTYAIADEILSITDLQIAGSTTSTINVKLLVSNGMIEMETIDGLTFTGGTSGDTLYFRGALSDINTALATLKYYREDTGSDTLEVSLVEPGEVFFGENGHLYKFISGSISWNSAKTAAEALTEYGVSGYLATITSADENDFVADRLQGDGWMGASDSASEGDWKWVTGPETGTSFWSGAAAGNAVDEAYENWASGEPNDHSSGEDCGQFYVSNGTWNDLPCTATIAGYVAEFGSPGNLPDVVARDISITTVNRPIVNSYSPADNATGVAVDGNLVLTFDKAVVTSTGSIYLKKVSDGSTVETFLASSNLISGTGGTTITINPSVTLDELTPYYLEIQSTAFTDSYGVGFSGFSASTTWNFTTGDFTAPTLSSVTSTAGTTTTTITWTTNELASSKVYYDLTTSYSASTTEADTSPRVTAHSVDLTGLVSCTTYRYAVHSTDAYTNTASTTGGTFRTGGCSGSTTPTDVTTTPITVSVGGSTTLTEDNSTITVTAPENSVSSTDSYVIQIHALPRSTVLAGIGAPAGKSTASLGDVVFDVKAVVDGVTELDSFDEPITISYVYTDAEVFGYTESTLTLYHYHDSIWEELDSCSVNTDTNTITCTTDGFSIFSIFGTPIPASSSGGGGAYTPPPAPTITAQSGISINNGAEKTQNLDVLIQFSLKNAEIVALSEKASFADAVFVPFSHTMPFTLSAGDGTKTVYAKVRSPQGGTLILEDSIVFGQSQAPKTTQNTGHEATPKQCKEVHAPASYILFGGANDESNVRLLEIFLNEHLDLDLAVDGIYDALDQQAVIAFQERYASEVLHPWGIQQGTGHVLRTTLAKMQAVANQSCAPYQENQIEAKDTGRISCQFSPIPLSFGLNNEAVMMLQKALTSLGYFGVDATGYFGPLTEDAVKKFQRDHAIKQVGIFGPKTRAALQSSAVCE